MADDSKDTENSKQLELEEQAVVDDSASQKTSLSGSLKWTTGRVELWAFYLYYVVCA